MISVENLTKSFGGNCLLDDFSFRVNRKERVGLVGRNGHGKTTLLKMIAGIMEPDDGGINTPRNYRIGYVQQDFSFSKPSVLEEGMLSLPANESDHHWKVERILNGLGFSEGDMQAKPAQLSGGYQVRLNLAKALIAEPDLLLLDEPTNFLDIAAIRWAEQFLAAWPHELILITHDRSFMDRLATHIVGIHRRKARKIEGDTQKYYDQIAQDESVYEKTRLNDEKRRREIELFITRFRAKARLANLVQSRIKTLNKITRKNKLERVETLEFSIPCAPVRSRHVLSAENLAFAYPHQRPLFDNLNFTVNRGDRICVVGRNGQGKSTLLRLLADKLQPDAGRFSLNPNIVSGHFDQTHSGNLVPERTVEEEVLSAYPQMGREAALRVCGTMLFTDGQAQKKISVLSGGEKSRVMLGKILVTPVNLLLLDEPTNHLDMDACDALLAALDNYEGTVIMVTHNEMFLHALAERLIVFQQGKVIVFDDTYQAFLDKIGWQLETGDTHSPGVATDAPAQAAEQAKQSRRVLRQQRSEIINARSRQLKPIEKKITATEKAIEKSEKALRGYNLEMADAAGDGDGERITGLSKAIHQTQTDIEQLYSRLETLSADLESLQAKFVTQLEGLEN